MGEKMRRFTFIATVAKRIAMLSLISVCLFSTCLSEQAAAKIIPITGPGKKIPGTDLMGTDTNLGFGPPGPGHGHIKPAICGLLGLSGIFDNASVVRIEVKNDYYHLVRLWSEAHKSQPAYWVGAVINCVPFNNTQFKNLPPRSDWRVFPAPPAPSSGGGIGTDISIPGSGTQYACIWAGVAGGLSEVPAGQGVANVVSTKVNSITTDSDVYAQSTAISNLTSYAWCTGFISPFKWNYYYSGLVWPASDASGILPGGLYPPISSNEYYCYIAGVTVISPGKINIWPSFPSGHYFEDISKGTSMTWNCLKYKQ
jgi:hypothetical protein